MSTDLLDAAEDSLRRARLATSEGERVAHVLYAAACLGTWIRERGERDSLAQRLAQSVVQARAARNDGSAR